MAIILHVDQVIDEIYSPGKQAEGGSRRQAVQDHGAGGSSGRRPETIILRGRYPNKLINPSSRAR